MIWRALEQLAPPREGRSPTRLSHEVSASSSFRAPHPGPLHRVSGPALSSRPRRVLGISAYYHDAAAAVVVDGEVVATVQEERLSRRNHDARFPGRAIAWCLAEAGLSLSQVDAVAYYEEPFLKADRLAACAASGSRAPDHHTRAARRNLTLPLGLRRALPWDGPLVFVRHHASHAASAYYPSRFAEAAVVVVDGVGEWATTSVGRAGPEGLVLLEEIDYPHSLGLLYSAVTDYLGFRINHDEYKVMALASYGQPTTYAAALDELAPGDPAGGFALDLRYFDHHRSPTRSWSDALPGRLGLPPRARDGEVTQAHYDLAAALQARTDRAMTALLTRARTLTGLDAVVLAGGVALNGVANHRAFLASGVSELFIQPAAGDAGGAMGAALYAYHHLPTPQAKAPRVERFDPFLGPRLTDAAVRDDLVKHRVSHHHYDSDEALCAVVARELAAGRVVGWCQGRMESGPRALGARSILADPRVPGMKETVNAKIKFREGFRPFAPAVPEARADDWFVLPTAREPAYSMLWVVPVRAERAAAVPAIVHVDGTARPQLVSAASAPRFHALLESFGALTGVPVLLNTSFNLAGEPIVNTPADALRTFSRCDLDTLVLERCVITKAGLAP